jgi:hypothetical protein
MLQKRPQKVTFCTSCWAYAGAYLCGDLWLCLSYDEARRYVPPQESDYTHTRKDDALLAGCHRLEAEQKRTSFYFLDRTQAGAMSAILPRGC